MYFLIRGPFRMIVEAQSEEEARQTAERILRNDGIKAQVIEARRLEERR